MSKRTVAWAAATSQTLGAGSPPIDEDLVGKTIASALIRKSMSGDEELLLKLTNGEEFIVSAFQREGYPVEMYLERSP